ncbi:MAG TPA: VIT1/CCC1 transporter family protein [Nitrososphaerales archaeon]|nr:VIT1/CCC1 transporter family protein [Nitrososphaerales archaeon]
MRHIPVEKHPHIPARRILDRVVLGGSDGAIEALSMTAALNGAGVAFHTILVAGFAFAVAGGISMFFSSYLSNKSEIDLLRIDVNRERMEIETEPEEEKAELEELLKKEGYQQREVDVIMERLVKDKELWLRTQLSHELRLHIEDLETDPFARPGSACSAFFALALVSLSPYAFASGRFEALLFSLVLSLASLFALASRAFTPRHFDWKSGIESAAVGAFAAGILYALGLAISAA